MRLVLLFFAALAWGQPPGVMVQAQSGDSRELCSEPGLLTPEPGVVETARKCFTRAQKVIARTVGGTELELAGIWGEDIGRDRLLLAFTVPANSTEPLFSVIKSKVMVRPLQKLDEWHARLSPVTDQAIQKALPLLDGSAEAAIEILEAAAGTNPQNAEVHYHLGTAYGRAGEIAKQIASWEKAVAVDAFHITAIEALLAAYVLEGREEKAKELVARVAQTSPFLAPRLQNVMERLRLEGISGELLPGQPAGPQR